jgi:protein-disulfide isomerase
MRHRGSVLLLLAALGCGSSSASPSANNKEAPGPTGPDGVPAVTPPVVPSSEVPAPVAAARQPTGPADDACSNAALELPPSTIVATVDGEPIRAEALGEDGRDAERDALYTYCREVHRIRMATTRRAVDDHLLARAARDKGVGTEEFVRTHLDTATKRPDEAEVEAWYNANKNEKAPPLELVRGQVEEAMMKERSQAAYDALLAGLRKSTKVDTKLPDVRPPAQDVAPAVHTATFGSADAKVRIVEFSDFECPYCSRAAKAVDAVKKQFGDQVQFAYRHFPLSFHPAARPAAELSQCAQEQGKFWALHDEIFEHQAELSAESLRGMAERAGLDMGKVDECLMSGRAAKQVEEDMAKANEVGVRGTPAFYVNGRAFDGNPEELVSAVDDELKG